MYHYELKPHRINIGSVADLEKEVQRLFDGFSRPVSELLPLCEILDQEKAFSIRMDIPGVKKEELEIEVKNNQLYVRGERKSLANSDEAQLLRAEIRYGKFQRIFSVPQNVNGDMIKARFENGVLELILPKEEKSQARKISISNLCSSEASSDYKS
jgi:HSP20 family protein